VPPFLRPSFVATYATYGHSFWQRPHAMRVTYNAVDKSGTLFSPSIAGSLRHIV